MRQLIFLVPLIGLLACGGPEKQKEEADEPVEQTTLPADPMEAACQAGTARSCLVAGDTAEKAGDAEKAATLYGEACELGEPSGCALGGGIWANLGDVPRGLELLKRGCELDEATSCYGAALVHMGMFGGDKDQGAAAAMLERGCALGLADACGSLAGLLEAGDGVPADPERARNLREQACEGGDGAACITLAVAAIDAGDAEEGRALLEKGCESDGRACTRRGLLALQAEKDPDTARMWFEKGCTGDLRDPDSCGWAGWLLHEGIGTEAEPERAEALITGACEAESATGCMFEAVVRARRGDAEKASELLGEACELEPEQCDGLTAQFEKLTK